MRHIILWYFCVEDASELHTLLSGSPGLKTLTLGSFGFRTVEPLEISADQRPRVMLDSLKMHYLHTANVQAIMNSFTVLVITRLRALYLHNTLMQPLLKTNAPSIQDLELSTYYSGKPFSLRPVRANRSPDEETASADALAGAHGLRSLDLKLSSLPSLNKMVCIFGSLDHLTRLRAVRVSVSGKTRQAKWPELDELLGKLPAPADVHLYSQWTSDEPHPQPPVRTWMPQQHDEYQGFRAGLARLAPDFKGPAGIRRNNAGGNLPIEHGGDRRVCVASCNREWL
ncbi:hypothetical protein DFH09DRAFT_1309300 [Mycena vulgaris]|nr:hypothetical protein DFH09DRAFT_1309300 [Mycena vulgaris]